MKKIFIITIFFYAFCVFGQNDNLPISILPSVWDFGVIKDSESVKHSFVIKNSGKKTITLKKLPTECGCLIAIPKPSVLKPGAISNFTVFFQPKGRRGPFHWEIKLATNIPQQPILVVTLKAFILKNAMFSDDIVNFRVTKKNKKNKKSLWMVCNYFKKFKIKSVTSDIKGFFISFHEEKEVIGFYPGKQRGYRIDVEIDNKTIGYGRNAGNIIITTNIPGKEIIKVPIFAYIIGDISVAPDYLSFGLLRKGRSKKRKLIISHHKFKEFTITKIVSSLSFISTELKTVVPKKYYILWVRCVYPKNPKKGEFRGKVEVFTDYEDQEKIVVKTQGYIRK